MEPPDIPSAPTQVPVPGPLPVEAIIRFIRGHRVLVDADLAVLYGVETRALLQSVRRNRLRFPGDFVFSLTREEIADLRSQFVISRSWGGRRHSVYVFTDQGVAMLSSVLKSPRAVLVNVEIMRAFVRLRKYLLSHAELARRLDELEEEYDQRFGVVFVALRRLMELPSSSKERIGFHGQAEETP